MLRGFRFTPGRADLPVLSTSEGNRWPVRSPLSIAKGTDPDRRGRAGNSRAHGMPLLGPLH